MKVEEAILYLLAERNGGMKAEQLAAEINRRHMCIRKDGQINDEFYVPEPGP